MGKGIDLARAGAPEHAQMLDDFKDQLLLTLIRRESERNGGKMVVVSANDVDSNGSYALSMCVEGQDFKFKVIKKH